MNQTPASLLERLKQPNQQAAWNSFVELYTPFLYQWARRQRLKEADAADLIQEVFLLLLRKLPVFHYEHDGSFRHWLRTLTLNKYRELQRRRRPQVGGDVLDDVAAPESPGAWSDTDERSHLVRHTLRGLQDQFPPSVWRLFEDCMVVGKTSQQVAQERKVSLGAVYAAKSKVIIRLRQELRGMLE